MAIECVFCRELRGSRETNFARLYPELRNRVIAETESFVAFPCIGQLVDGHFLIIPRAHDCTLAQTHFRLGSAASELQDLLSSAHEVLGESPSESMFFEHGTLGPKDGGCGIYHAHLHVLPGVGHIDGSNFIQNTNICESDSLAHIYENIFHEQAYALVGSVVHGFKSWTITEPLPSQTLRKKMASALENIVWDWRKAGREESLIKLLEKVNP